MIKDLCRIVFLYQKALTIPSEKYAVLCILRIIEEIISACSDSTYLKFLTDYLENLVNFARGDKMMPIERPDDLHGIKSVDIREELLEVLGLYGEKKDSDLLDRIVARENDSIVKKVAVLVQSGNRLENVISRQMQNAIKREILKTLSLATDETTDFVEDNGGIPWHRKRPAGIQVFFFYRATERERAESAGQHNERGLRISQFSCRRDIIPGCK